MSQPLNQLCGSWNEGKHWFSSTLRGRNTVIIKCVCFTHLFVSFRHKLDEAMLTDPWDSMKHADLGGFSTPFGSNQILFCHTSSQLWYLGVCWQPWEHEQGKKGREKIWNIDLRRG